MTDSKNIDYNPVVWVSLASVSGLSLVSLGQPGLRTDLDEQVYTGGLTAVKAMLGGEVGGDTDRFVGGSHSNRTGSFIRRTDTGGELVGQYLLISSTNIKVADDLAEHYEYLVTILAEITLKTELYKRVEREFRALGVDDVLDLFLESVVKARKKKSISLDNKYFFSALKQVVMKSVNDYEYSSTLVKIAEFKGKYRDLSPRVKAEKDKILLEFTEDLLELLTSDHPHALVLFPKIKSIKKDLFKYLQTEIRTLSAREGFEEIIKDFESTDLTKFLDDFALHEVNKTNLLARLEEEIFHKFKREFPLLFLIDPEIEGFKTAIEKLTAEINEQYDLGGTLSHIGIDMLKNHQEFEDLFVPYIRHYCDRFSTGLTTSAWKYMQVLFRIMTQTTKIDVQQVLPSLKGKIPDSHFSTLEKMITRYKLTKIDPLSFSVRQASDILPFYRALFSSLAYGLNIVMENMVFSAKNPNNLLRVTVRNFKDFTNQIQPVYGLYSIYAYMEKQQRRVNFNIAFPEPDDFGKNIDVTTWTSEIILDAFIKANINGITKEQKLVDLRIGEFRSEFEKRISDIKKFHTRNPQDISKGYDLKLNETKKLSFSTKPARDVEEILGKIVEDYTKLFTKAEQDLNKAKEAAKKFLNGNLSETELQKQLSDTRYLTKAKDNFEKFIKKAHEAIPKKYADLSSGVEKKFRGFNKDFSKEFAFASNFLNIDKKTVSKGSKDFLPSSSPIRQSIRKSVDQIIERDPLINWDNCGYYYFHAINKKLPLEYQIEITNSLLSKKSFIFLKEATESLKLNPTKDLFRCYSDILGSYIKDILIRLFGEVGSHLGKNFLRLDKEVYFIERKKVPIPTLMMGILLSVNAMNSIRNVLGSKIAVESEKNEGSTVFHISAVIPEFDINFKNLKKTWKTKEWTLHRVLLLLSWHSLLEKNGFFVNMLRFSSSLYSARVKESFDEVFNQIEKFLVFH